MEKKAPDLTARVDTHEFTAIDPGVEMTTFIAREVNPIANPRPDLNPPSKPYSPALSQCYSAQSLSH